LDYSQIPVDMNTLQTPPQLERIDRTRQNLTLRSGRAKRYQPPVCLVSMAFIGREGNSYYLVHNVRVEGCVGQLQLACLGQKPRISDEIVRSVTDKHPFIRVDWARLRQPAAHEPVQPMLSNSGYLRRLLEEVRGVHLDSADFQWVAFEVLRDRELRAQFAAEFKLLRGTLEVKLGQLRKGRFASLQA